MKRKLFYADAEWQEMLEFSEALPTPFIIIKLDRVRQKYEELAKCFPGSQIHYAVKANPAPEIISLLHQIGSYFDIASRYEMDKVLALGVPSEKLLFGNTIKKASDIEYAYQKGIRLFATDCRSDLENIAKYAPGSQVYVRILVQGGETADWPLSRKFGCHPMMSISLLEAAASLGLIPYGISFHVGSQQRAVWQWNDALDTVAHIFSLAEKVGIHLEMINMGGGFPANYVNKIHGIEDYASEIRRYLIDHFGCQIPKIILEPGRSLVGNAGILVTEIITVAKKSRSDGHSWVYLDAGKFNGLIEAIDDGAKYPVVMAEDDEEERVGEVILAGPTCDSADIMYDKDRYKLPLNIRSGQRLYWLSAGAYTTSYASIEFNGFPPIQSYFMGK